MLIALLILVGYSEVVTAQDNDIHVSVGAKTWSAIWTSSFDGQTGSKVNIDSDLSVMAGPTVNFQSGKFFVGITFLTGDFIFPNQELCQAITCLSDLSIEAKFNRTDLDIALGYRFTPNVGAFIGNKKIDFKSKLTCTDNNPNDSNVCNIGTIEGQPTTASGPVFGVNLTLPIDQTRWFFVGNLSFLLLTNKVSGQPDTDSTGPSAEVNLVYLAETMPVSLSIGAKFQNIEAEKTKDVDEFTGLMLGANYTF